MQRPSPRGPVRPALLALPLLLLAVPAVAGQSGPDITRRAMELHAQRLAGVENITVVQETMGMETIQYMEKREVNGGAALVPVQTAVAGLATPVPDLMSGDWTALQNAQWIEDVRLEGTDVLDGRAMYVLVQDDFSGIDLSGLAGGEMGDVELRPTRFRSLVDAESLLGRSIQVEGQIRREGGDWIPFQMEIRHDDYREIEGYLHPFSTRIRTWGLMGLMGDNAQMSAQVAEMRQQLESMPADQRALIDGMLGGAVDRIAGMMGDDGAMEVVTTVREVRVNEGMPDR